MVVGGMFYPYEKQGRGGCVFKFKICFYAGA